MNNHTLKARQRNDAELAKNEVKLELIDAKKTALEAELAEKMKALETEQTDLNTERRALMAMAVALRDQGGQL